MRRLMGATMGLPPHPPKDGHVRKEITNFLEYPHLLKHPYLMERAFVCVRVVPYAGTVPAAASPSNNNGPYLEPTA